MGFTLEEGELRVKLDLPLLGPDWLPHYRFRQMFTPGSRVVTPDKLKALLTLANITVS